MTTKSFGSERKIKIESTLASH